MNKFLKSSEINSKHEIAKIRTKIASDNDEMKQSIDKIKLQMAQLAEDNKKISESLEEIVGTLL